MADIHNAMAYEYAENARKASGGGANCGIGSGGFQPGNKCAKGSGGGGIAVGTKVKVKFGSGSFSGSEGKITSGPHTRGGKTTYRLKTKSGRVLEYDEKALDIKPAKGMGGGRSPASHFILGVRELRPQRAAAKTPSVVSKAAAASKAAKDSKSHMTAAEAHYKVAEHYAKTNKKASMAAYKQYEKHYDKAEALKKAGKKKPNRKQTKEARQLSVSIGSWSGRAAPTAVKKSFLEKTKSFLGKEVEAKGNTLYGGGKLSKAIQEYASKRGFSSRVSEFSASAKSERRVFSDKHGNTFSWESWKSGKSQVKFYDPVH